MKNSNKKEIMIIKKIILKNEAIVKKCGKDKYNGTSHDSLTGRYWCFNWLSTPIGDILIPKIKNIIVRHWCKVTCRYTMLGKHF